MKNQITSRDIELLSVYLDDQLGSKERVKLEARLKTEPALQKELQELSTTRTLLRNLPRLRAPRNYFITAQVAEQVAPRHTMRYAPAYGIISAIATILLVLVIFGDRLLSSTAPVALAPASVVVNETVVVQQEGQRNAVPTSAPTEAPVVMMQAPPLPETQSPSMVAKVGESEAPTPTTVYLNAYPPPATSESTVTILNEQTMTATLSCEVYDASGSSQPLPKNCSTPVGSPSGNLQSLPPTSTPSSAGASTPALTSTLAPSAVPSITPAPSDTPVATPESNLVPTEITPSIVIITPELETGTPIIAAPSAHEIVTGMPSPSVTEAAETPGTAPNLDFTQYIVLALELSLAAIAIVAGIIAIIQRMRAGR
jgi:hypothetical protein